MRHVRLNVVVHESDFHLRRSFAVRGAAQTRRPASRAAGGGKWWHCQDGASNGCRRTSHATAAPFPPGARLCTCGRGNLYTQVAATANVNARGCSLLAASGTWGCSLAHMGLQPAPTAARLSRRRLGTPREAPVPLPRAKAAHRTGRCCRPHRAARHARGSAHASGLWRQCHCTHMPFSTCDVQCTMQWCACGVHAVCMQCACGVHAVCMIALH